MPKTDKEPMFTSSKLHEALRLLITFSLIVVFYACSSSFPRAMPEADLELLYISADEVFPTTTALRFYSPRTLELEPLGDRATRRRLDSSDARAISALLISADDICRAQERGDTEGRGSTLR